MQFWVVAEEGSCKLPERVDCNQTRTPPVVVLDSIVEVREVVPALQVQLRDVSQISILDARADVLCQILAKLRRVGVPAPMSLCCSSRQYT